MSKIFALSIRATAYLLILCCVLMLSIAVVNSQDRVIARVWGKAIHTNEVKPTEREAAAKRAALGSLEYKSWWEIEVKERLRQRIWCELATGYLQQNRLGPTPEQIKAYAAGSVGRTAGCFGPQGESNDLATLSTLKFDQLLYNKYGGHVVAKGPDWLPVDARRAYLEEARAKRIVEILDSKVSGALSSDLSEISTTIIANQNAREYFDHPWWDETVSSEPQKPAAEPFQIKALDGDKVVSIDCANGFRFIIRKAADNLWYEETKVRSDAAVKYKTTKEAATSRCTRPSR